MIIYEPHSRLMDLLPKVFAVFAPPRLLYIVFCLPAAVEAIRSPYNTHVTNPLRSHTTTIVASILVGQRKMNSVHGQYYFGGNG